MFLIIRLYQKSPIEHATLKNYVGMYEYAFTEEWCNFFSLQRMNKLITATEHAESNRS